jgi:hypothetical protein
MRNVKGFAKEQEAAKKDVEQAFGVLPLLQNQFLTTTYFGR